MPVPLSVSALVERFRRAAIPGWESLPPGRRSRSAALHIVLWSALILDVAFSLLVVPGVLGYRSALLSDPRWLTPTLCVPVLIVLISVASRRPERASSLLVAFSVVASWAFVLGQLRLVGDPRELARGLLLLSLSQLFAGLFLDWRGILRVATANLAGLLLLPWVTPHLGTSDAIGTSVLYAFVLLLTGAGAVLHQLDLSDLRKAMEETHRLEAALEKGHRLEALGRLAGGVAHDFNNMLTTIFARLDAARPRALDPLLLRELDGIERSAERAAGVVRRLLDSARVQPPRLQEIPAPQLLGEAAELVRPLLPESIELRVEDGPGDALRIDVGQISQVLTNLVVNARDALLSTPAGRGRITLRHRPARPSDFRGTRQSAVEGWRVLEVADTGPGIEPAAVGRLFEPFFTTKPAGKGTGLGLWNALTILQAHDGDIGVETAPGNGATFRLLLPPGEGRLLAPESGPDSSAGMPDIPSRSLLLIDDEEAIRELATMALREAGWDVACAGDGERALERYAAGSGFDLVVLDLSLPGIPGREVARRILSLRPDQAILVTTGHELGSEPGAPPVPGARRTLLKPFRMATLVRECEKAAPRDQPRA